MKRRHGDLESAEPRRIKSPPIITDADEISKLIPSFSPSSKSNLSAKQWIEKIDHIRAIHGWDERSTLTYAILRLKLPDRDKNWPDGNLNNWAEFKVNFIRRFSKHSNTSKAEYFERLKRRHQKDEESFEDYVKEVDRIAKKCDCSLEDTIIYIILGLEDSIMRSELFALKSKNIDELLLNFKTVVSKRNQFDRSAVTKSDNHQNGAPGAGVSHQTQIADYERDDERPRRSPHLRQASKEYVFNPKAFCKVCNKIGHHSSDCYFNPDNYCSVCNKKGHKSEFCPSNITKEFSEERRNERNPEHIRKYCKICEMRGHHTNDCKHNKNGSYPVASGSNQLFYRNRNEEVRNDTENTDMKCFRCRKWGHHQGNCPLTISEDNKFQNSPRESRYADANKNISKHTRQHNLDEHDLSELLDEIKQEPE